MRLYHGTTDKIAEIALRDGLKPRGERPSLWDAPSHPDCIYLTDAYAMHFAAHASKKAPGSRPAIIEIDTAELDLDLLYADEDALAICFKDGMVDPGPDKHRLRAASMEELAAYFAKDLPSWAEYGADWRWSLQVIGNCTYHGSIPSEAVSRVTVFNADNPWWIRWHDPLISPHNYNFFSGYYRASNLVFVGRENEARETPTGIQPLDIDEMAGDVTKHSTRLK